MGTCAGNKGLSTWDLAEEGNAYFKGRMSIRGTGNKSKCKSALMGCDIRAPTDMPAIVVLELAKNEVLGSTHT